MPGYRPEDEWAVTDETGERMTGGWKLIVVLVVALVAVALVAKFAAVPVWVFAALAAFVGLPTFCIWKIIAGLRTGVVRVRNGSYSRGEDPFWYWTLIALLAGLAAWLPGLLILVALHAH
jgi:hypothetical protein